MNYEIRLLICLILGVFSVESPQLAVPEDLITKMVIATMFYLGLVSFTSWVASSLKNLIGRGQN